MTHKKDYIWYIVFIFKTYVWNITPTKLLVFCQDT